eukprot:Clim_evm114s134 gene=Clim_evmTU114s134
MSLAQRFSRLPLRSAGFATVPVLRSFVPQRIALHPHRAIAMAARLRNNGIPPGRPGPSGTGPMGAGGRAPPAGAQGAYPPGQQQPPQGPGAPPENDGVIVDGSGRKIEHAPKDPKSSDDTTLGAQQAGGKPKPRIPMVELDPSNINAILSGRKEPVLLFGYVANHGPSVEAENLVRQFVSGLGGQVIIGRLNVQAQQMLAQQLQIQSAPVVYLIHQGRMLDRFAGQPREMPAFLQRIQQMLGIKRERTVADMLEEANSFRLQGNYGQADDVFNAIVQHKDSSDQQRAQALAGVCQCKAITGDIADARTLLTELKEQFKAAQTLPEVKEAVASVELAEDGSGVDVAALEAQLANLEGAAKNQALYDLTIGYFASNQPQKSLETMIALTRADKKWNNGAATRVANRLFSALPKDADYVKEFRKRFKNMLYL